MLTVLEAGKSKIRMPAWLGPGEGVLLGCRLWLLAFSQYKMSKEALWGLFYKITNPVYEGLSLMTYYLPNAHFLIPWELGFQHVNFGGIRYSVYRRLLFQHLNSCMILGKLFNLYSLIFFSPANWGWCYLSYLVVVRIKWGNLCKGLIMEFDTW